MPVALLPPDEDTGFPAVETAAREPNGLLAVGGDLRPARLLRAYRHGIFPWFGNGEPILWWSPDPRCVLVPAHLHISRRLRRTLRTAPFVVTRDADFPGVVHGCAEPRRDSPGTWLVQPMIDAFIELHRLGHATSFECWHGERLVGGIYGVRLGQVLFGESMFSRETDASKIALTQAAAADDITLIDCQITNPHLERLGAEEVPRERFLRLLRHHGVPAD